MIGSVQWPLVILLLVRLSYGQDTFSQQLLARIEQLERQGWLLKNSFYADTVLWTGPSKSSELCTVSFTDIGVQLLG